MKILYLTLETEDYVEDSVLYGLRMKYGADVVDFPKKESMYIGGKDGVDYGGGFTLWGLLPDIAIDRDKMLEKIESGVFDVIIFANIYRQQDIYTHWNVYLLLEKMKNMGKKIVFIDGTDDGKPAVTEAFNWGPYFKRDNPYHYPNVKMIGISIPECKILTEKPEKTKPFTRYVQDPDMYRFKEINEQCSRERFTKEEDYYADLKISRFGFATKKSGWDTPRLMEHAANWVVNCINTKGWEWDGKSWYEKPDYTHPLGFVDMKNCILWSSPEELRDKIKSLDSFQYDQLSQASHDWVLTKTCEKSAEYVMENI